MKNKKIDKYDFINSDDIIDLLLFEINILQKKINNENLTPKEKLFDSYIVSPSSVIRDLIKNSKINESGDIHV